MFYQRLKISSMTVVTTNLNRQNLGEQTDEPFGRYHCPGES